jgi:hypothetical protein
MPLSAVAAGMVDLVLRPDKMPEAVIEYLQQPYIRSGNPAAAVQAEGAQAAAMREAGAEVNVTQSGSSEAMLSLIRSCCPQEDRPADSPWQ